MCRVMFDEQKEKTEKFKINIKQHHIFHMDVSVYNTTYWRYRAALCLVNILLNDGVYIQFFFLLLLYPSSFHISFCFCFQTIFRFVFKFFFFIMISFGFFTKFFSVIPFSLVHLICVFTFFSSSFPHREAIFEERKCEKEMVE